MSFRGVFSLYTLVLGAFLIPSPATSAEHAGSETQAASSTPPPAGGVLTDNEMKAISWFGLPESIVRGRWNDSLPVALEKAMKDKDEDAVAKILATVTGTVNTIQLFDIQKRALEKGQGLEQGNNRYAELLKRLAWLKEIKVPGGPTLPIFKAEGEEFQRFKTAFDRHWEDVKRKNEEFYRLLANANNPASPTREDSKQKLLAYGDREVMAFLASQAGSGNDAVVNDFGKATGFTGNTGKSFIDAATADGRLVRINHDTGQLANSLREFDRSGNGLARDLRFSKTRHPRNPDVNFVPTGRPAAPAIERPKQVPPVQNPPKQNPPTPRQDPPANDPVALGKAVMKARCLSCHNTRPADQGGRARGGFKINEDGSLQDPTMLSRVILRAVVGSEDEGGPMPPAPSARIPESERSVLRAWATAGGSRP